MGKLREQPRRERRIGKHLLLRVGVPLLANALYASVACARHTLEHLDPLVFCALQMLLLLPLSGALLLRARGQQATRFRQGLTGGSILSIGFLCVILSLRAIGIIPTAMLTALDGLFASLLAWVWRHQIPNGYTLLACGCAGAGAALLWLGGPQDWQADLVALVCGLCFSIYSLWVEYSGLSQQPPRQWWSFFGGLFAALAATTLLLALCFGRWASLRTLTGGDLLVLLYTSVATVAVPVVLLTMLLRHLSAVTLAILAVWEPLLSLGWAMLLGFFSLPTASWIGVGCISLALLVQVWTAAIPTQDRKQRANANVAPANAGMENAHPSLRP